jgi:hypothetical protein
MKRSARDKADARPGGAKRANTPAAPAVASKAKKGTDAKQSATEIDLDPVAWLNSTEAMRAWMSKYDLPKLLEEGKVRTG